MSCCVGGPVFLKVLARLRPVLWCFVAGLVILSVARIGLALWKFDDVTQANGWASVLLQGLRVDVATLCLLLGPLAIALLLLPARRLVHVVASIVV